ncbi:ATP-dependent DNA helicase PIF1-like protein [Tanacetum coccineum]
MSTSTTSNSKPLMLDQLELGVTGTIVVMICRMWDVNFATGRYLSTFIVSDEKGNVMHCTTRGNIAHNFLRLKEGAIYSVKNFTVQPNKDDFRVLRFAHFIVEMDEDTVVRKSSVRPDGFARYPFQLVEFDSLEPTNNKYLIDRLYLSSTSSTMIVDDKQIPVLKQFKSDDSGIELVKELLPVDSTGAKAETLKNLLMWARNRKYDAATFHCAVRINKIKTKREWNYPSCSGEKCKKGNLDRKHGRFWCDSCHSSVDYPVLRYRLELEVSDDTFQTVVVMFDETARTVVKYEEDTGLPPALANIVGTIHTLELKSNLYFEHANYESFTCWTIILEEALDESGSSGTLVAAGGPKTGVFVPLTTTPSVTTPSKPGE